MRDTGEFTTENILKVAQDFQAALRPMRLRPTKGLFANASRISRRLWRQRPLLENYGALDAL